MKSRSRAGVSPMVSDVMLTSIVVIAMTILLAWATWYAYSHPSKFAVEERFFIGNVWFNGTSPRWTNMSIWIYNFGEIEVSISYVYINGTDVTDYGSVGGSPLRDNPLSLMPGEDGVIEVRPPNGFWPGAPQRVRVVSSRGSHYEALVVAPQVS